MTTSKLRLGPHVPRGLQSLARAPPGSHVPSLLTQNRRDARPVPFDVSTVADRRLTLVDRQLLIIDFDVRLSVVDRYQLSTVNPSTVEGRQSKIDRGWTYDGRPRIRSSVNGRHGVKARSLSVDSRCHFFLAADPRCLVSLVFFFACEVLACPPHLRFLRPPSRA